MASYLGVRCGKTFSFLNAEETETRLGRRTKARPGGGGGGFHHPYHHHHLNPNPTNKPTQQQTNKKQTMIIARACLSSNLDYNNCRAAVSSSASPINVDPIFGTELEMCCNNRTGEKQQRANAKKRENKVGSVGGEQKKISAEKLDEWMTYSVSEIVRNIGEAPLLVHVYSSKNNNNKGGSSVGSPPTTIPIPIIERRKAEPESWVDITRRWEEGSPIPDGIILVEQLKDEEPAADINASSSSSSSTKTWGVVIQGRGADSASSCYILKTCRVRSSLGGGFCTHFCLVRAKCFGEIADLQLKNSWLVA